MRKGICFRFWPQLRSIPLLLAFALVACGGDSDAPVSATAGDTSLNIEASLSELQLGGSDGRAFGALDLSLQTNTGSNTYPWTAILTTDNGVNWFSLDQNQGSLGGSPTVVHVSTDPSRVAVGTFKGSLRIDVNVDGRAFSKVFPVTLSRNSHRLVASQNGVLLSQFPASVPPSPVGDARQHLSQSVLVSSSWEGHSVDWTATSDQPWLTVTSQGKTANRGELTGTNLTVQADPSGLAMDALHTANVTISSSDPSLDVAQETMRVSLWIGSTGLKEQTFKFDNPTFVGSPSEPVVFVHNGSGAIHAYNIYTAALSRTLSTPVTNLRGLEISADGSKLFVLDADNWDTFILDAQSGAVLATFAKDPSVSYSGDGSVGLQFARPDGHAVIITPWSEVFSIDTGERLARVVTVESGPAGDWGDLRALRADSHYLYSMQAGANPSTLDRWTLSFDALSGNTLRTHRSVLMASSSARGRDICVSTDGTLVYTIESAGADVAIRDASTLISQGNLPLPKLAGYFSTLEASALECAQDAVVARVGTHRPSADILAYSPRGESIISQSGGTLPGIARRQRALWISGDLLRTVQADDVPASPFPEPAYTRLVFLTLPPFEK